MSSQYQIPGGRSLAYQSHQDRPEDETAISPLDVMHQIAFHGGTSRAQL
jgi:hypothetical protein